MTASRSPAVAVRLAGVRRTLSSRAALATRLLVQVDRRLDTGRHRTWDEVAQALSGMRPTDITVDVFDTVLVRRVAGDDSLWWIVATSLIATGGWRASPEAFIAARRAAALAAPADGLELLYARVELANLRTSTGAATESSIEAELAVAVPGAATALGFLRAAGHEITFLSDMHLHDDALRRSLSEHGLASPQDRLVISSTVGASKSSGTLFPALTREPTGPSWHIGNDPWSDVAMAERAGVRALPIRSAEASAVEKIMMTRPGSVASALAAAARQVRTRHVPSNPAEASLREVGADVAGQCLGAFLFWVRAECRRSSIKQVCFLARDGELPLRMARAMPSDHWDDVGLHYLQGSRRLWSAAAAHVLGVDQWLEAGTGKESGFLRQNEHVLPWRSLLVRALLTAEDLADHPALIGVNGDRPLPLHLHQEWRELLRDPRLQSRLAARAAEQYRNLREILLAEGVGSAPMALVDVGWTGQLAWQVSAVIREVTGHEPLHLHFGGVNVADGLDGLVVRRFAVDNTRAPLPFDEVISCVETLTASGAARARSTFRPVGGPSELVMDDANPLMDTEERRLMWSAAVEVASALPDRATLDRWGLHEEGLAEQVCQVLTVFWTAPARRHAQAGARLASEVDDDGIGVHRVATAYRLREFIGDADSSTRTWRQGSLRLTGRPMRWVVRGAMLIKKSRG